MTTNENDYNLNTSTHPSTPIISTSTTPLQLNEKKILENSFSKDSQDEQSQLQSQSRKIEKRKTIKTLQTGEGNINEIEMCGYLQKRRGGFGRHMPNAWQQRYFTLKDGIMYYYEDSGSDSRPRGKIDLKTENCDFMNGLVFEGAPTPYTMQIIPGGWEEKWKLCATTKEEMENWVAAIMKHITDETKRKPQQINIRSYVSDEDDEVDDDEAEEDDGPHLKLHGVPVSGGASIITPTSNSQNPTTSSINSTPTSTSNSNSNSSSNTNTNTTTNQTTNLNNNSSQQTIGSQNVNLGSSTNNTNSNTTTTTSSLSTATTNSTISKVSTTTTSTSSNNSSGKGKRKLKLQTDASAENDDMEFITVVIIVNLCLLFAYTTPHLIMSIFYLIVLNVVIARTLQLRALRLVHQHHSLTTTHNTAMKALQETHHQAIQALKESLRESNLKNTDNVNLTNISNIVSEIESKEAEIVSSKPSGPPPPGNIF